MKTITIKGFGRIGRLIFRRLFSLDQNNFKITEIIENSLTINEAAYLLKYDSSYGIFDSSIDVLDNKIIVSSKNKKWIVNFSTQVNNKNDYLFDSSGSETDIDLNSKVYSKFSKVFFTYWVDRVDNFFFKDAIKENTGKFYFCGLCDTISLLPILTSLSIDEVQQIYITTIHPYLSYQNLLDGHSKSGGMQIGRSSINSIIAKQSSIPKVLSKLLPHLHDKVIFNTYRAPTSLVTVADINILFEKKISISRIISIKNELEKNKFDNLPHSSIDFLNLNDREYGIDVNCSNIDKNNLHITIFYNNEITYVGYITKILLKYFCD